MFKSLDFLYLLRLKSSANIFVINLSKMPIKEEDQVLRFVKLTPNAYCPTKGSPDAAGFDLYR